MFLNNFSIAAVAMAMLTSCAPAHISPPDQTPTPPATEQPDPPKSNTVKITIGNTVFAATLATNTTTTAFKTILPLTLSMSDFNGNEKVASLPSSLTTAATNPVTIHTGDIMLYGSNSLVMFYETFSTSYSYTKIGRIDNATGLKAAVGNGTVTIKFEIDGD